MHKYPRVGIGTIILNNNKVLLGKRKNSHGEGCWCFPGGHLEWEESFAACAIRETFEETGITLKSVKQVAVTNDYFSPEDKHYITIFMQSVIADPQTMVKEPEKCECWEWFDWDNLPEPLFLPIRNLLLQNYQPLKYLDKF